MENAVYGYESERLKSDGYKIIDMLSDYLEGYNTNKLRTALPNISPEEMLNFWDGDFTKREDFEPLVKKILEQSNHLHNPKYIGHQVSAPLPFAVLSELIARLLNNASAIYEMGMVNIAMEKRVIDWMKNILGYDSKADGIFTSGGTIGNLTALLAARQGKADYDVWSDGIKSDKKYVVMVSEEAHYSISKAVSIMGLGEKSVCKLPVDRNFKIDNNSLKKIYIDLKNEGKEVLALVGNACSTATGAFDDLNFLADFCEENNIWFHVDGAHGASFILSEKYKYLLDGVNRADSMIWDAHKMMLMPALITAVIFKDGKKSYESFSHKGSYVFEQDAEKEWYDFAHRTIECTKTMMGLKLYLSLKYYGQDYFANYVQSRIDLTREFADLLAQQKDFELAVSPECNIICFRYLKGSESDLCDFQRGIRKKINQSEKFYIVGVELNGKYFLRCTIINPMTKLDDLKELLNEIRKINL